MSIKKTAAEIVPNLKNPRAMGKDELDGLKRSMDTFGDLSGFVVNVVTNRLAGAHQRLKVTPSDSVIEIVNVYNPATKVGTVREGFIVIKGERFAYREVEWDEKTEALALLAANKHKGEWDGLKMSDYMADINLAPGDLELAGFKDGEMEDLTKTAGTLDDVEEEKISDLTMQWSKSEVRQMVIALGAETFSEIMEILERLKKSRDLESNTDAFIYLVRAWDHENNGPILRKRERAEFSETAADGDGLFAED